MHPLRGVRRDAQPLLQGAREVEAPRHLSSLPDREGGDILLRRPGMRYLLAASLLASVYAGCNGGAAPVSIPGGPSVALGQEFTLGPGESVSLADGVLSVRFERVTEDSRCPRGVNCVWEGDAVVAIVASRAGASGQHQLH